MIGLVRRRDGGSLLNAPASSDQPLLTASVVRVRGPRERGELSEPSIWTPLIALIVLAAFLTYASPVFLTEQNLTNLLRQVSTFAPLAIGMTFVFLVRGVDLSIGGIIALTGFVAATVASDTGWTAALVAAMAVGAVCGLVQGVLVAQWRLPAFFVTLVGLLVFRSAATLVSENRFVTVEGSADWLGGTDPLATMLVISGGLSILAYVILRSTSYGARVREGGSVWIVGSAYVVMGLCSGLSAFLMMFWLRAYTTSLGTGYELMAIAAVVIGGASVFGGSGSIIGSLLGLAIIQTAQNGFLLASFSPFLQPAVVGGMALIAAIYYSRRRNA